MHATIHARGVHSFPVCRHSVPARRRAAPGAPVRPAPTTCARPGAARGSAEAAAAARGRGWRGAGLGAGGGRSLREAGRVGSPGRAGSGARPRRGGGGGARRGGSGEQLGGPETMWTGGRRPGRLRRAVSTCEPSREGRARGRGGAGRAPRRGGPCARPGPLPPPPSRPAGPSSAGRLVGLTARAPGNSLSGGAGGAGRGWDARPPRAALPPMRPERKGR
jgi:hypothetical protein